MNAVAVNRQPDAIKRFLRVYARLDTAGLERLDSIYHDNIVFVDPMRRINGLAGLKDHFASLYRNLIECRFDFDTVIGGDTVYSIEWRMHYRHPSVGRGRTITVRGCSALQFCENSGLVISHRDYFDMGEMLYEHLPVIGGIVKAVKRRAGA